jgi:hypothetical protein
LRAIARRNSVEFHEKQAFKTGEGEPELKTNRFRSSARFSFMALAALALATAAMQVRAQSTLDAAFNPNANDSLVSIVVQADTKTLAGGAFSTIASNGSGAVTRDGTACLQIDGRLDQTVDPCRWDIGWKANATSLGVEPVTGTSSP